MKRIEFYRTINGASPVEEFLETLGVASDEGTESDTVKLFQQTGQHGRYLGSAGAVRLNQENEII